MARLLCAALCIALLALALGGCGYSFAGSAAPNSPQASRLAPEFRKMFLARVENPSTETWLEARLRSLIRDEFSRRRMVEWTDRSQATSLLTVSVKRYTRQTAVAGSSDQSVKLSAGIILSAKVTRAADGVVLWQSEELNQGESFYPGDSDGADMRLTDLAIRRLADFMSENY